MDKLFMHELRIAWITDLMKKKKLITFMAIVINIHIEGNIVVPDAFHFSLETWDLSGHNLVQNIIVTICERCYLFFFLQLMIDCF